MPAQVETPGQLVRRLRKARDMRLVDLGDIVGVSASVMCDIENGKARITGDVAMALARWAGEAPEVFWQPREKGEE